MNLLSNTGIRIALKWLLTALIIGAVLLLVDGKTLIREVARVPPSCVGDWACVRYWSGVFVGLAVALYCRPSRPSDTLYAGCT